MGPFDLKGFAISRIERDGVALPRGLELKDGEQVGGHTCRHRLWERIYSRRSETGEWISARRCPDVCETVETG